MENQINVDDQNTQQIGQNPDVQPVQIPEKPKVNYLAVGAIILIGFVLFVFGGYYLVKQSSKNRSLNQNQTTPLPTSTENDATTNWRTYTDSEAGFSLKYPNDYFIFQGDPSLGFFVATSPTQGGNGPKFLPNQTDVWLTAFVSKNINIQTLDEYLTSQQNSFQNLTKIPTTVGNISAYKTVSTVQSFCAGDTCATIYVYDGLVLKNNSIYTIAMSSLDQKALYANQTIFDQILSTFKFLDRSSTTQTVTTDGEKIIASEVTVEGCKIKVTTNKREIFLDTSFLESDPQTKCYQFVLNQVSPSGKYMVFQDISGGIDSKASVYSIEHEDTLTLYVFGTSNIFDIAFLPDNSAVVLYGYKGNYNEQYLAIYNLPELFRSYPTNIDQYKYFTNLDQNSKRITLPDVGQDYAGMSVSDGKLRISGNGNIKLKEFNITDLKVGPRP